MLNMLNKRKFSPNKSINDIKKSIKKSIYSPINNVVNNDSNNNISHSPSSITNDNNNQNIVSSFRTKTYTRVKPPSIIAKSNKRTIKKTMTHAELLQQKHDKEQEQKEDNDQEDKDQEDKDQDDKEINNSDIQIKNNKSRVISRFFKNTEKLRQSIFLSKICLAIYLVFIRYILFFLLFHL